MPDRSAADRTALVVGASRNIGLEIACELMRRGWDVVATVRGHEPEALRQLAERTGRTLTIEKLDMTEPVQIAALRDRLDDLSLDLLSVNAWCPVEPSR